MTPASRSILAAAAFTWAIACGRVGYEGGALSNGPPGASDGAAMPGDSAVAEIDSGSGGEPSDAGDPMVTSDATVEPDAMTSEPMSAPDSGTTAIDSGTTAPEPTPVDSGTSSPSGETCGSVTCPSGQLCCDALCGTCVRPGQRCTLGCPGPPA